MRQLATLDEAPWSVRGVNTASILPISIHALGADVTSLIASTRAEGADGGSCAFGSLLGATTLSAPRQAGRA